MATESSSISVVPLVGKVCKPFLLEVMVFSPESGFKFKVLVERSCTPEADAVLKIVFDLYKLEGGQETQLVHVSYTSGTPAEQQAVQAMASDGVKPAQADVLVQKVHPAAKAVVGVKKPTKQQRAALHDSMQEVVSLAV